MSIKEIVSPTRGILGYLHDIEYKEENSILIFQLPRATNMLNSEYIQSALEVLARSLPEGRKAIVIGADIDIYELASADAVILKLKGLI